MPGTELAARIGGNPVAQGILGAVLLLAGCSPTVPTCDDAADASPPAVTPTWHADVRPLFEITCARCHWDGGPGGFALDTYDDASTWAPAAASAVAARTMPPFATASCCQEYDGELDLSPDQIAAVVAWADAGAPEGDPADYVAPEPVSTELPRVDLSLTMDSAYVPDLPDGETDVSRCFLLDWPEEEPRYVTGLGVRPGNAAVVHHAIALLAGPSVVDSFEALDAADPGAGWTCPGGVVWGATGWLGGWSPGWTGRAIPGGLGHRVEPGSKVILSVHYSVTSADPEPDQTTLDLMLADEVTGTLESLSVYDPTWLTGGMPIPAGRPDVVHSHATTPTPRSDGSSRRLVAVNLHMHERGSHGQVGIRHADGTTTCLLQIDRWDYDWQNDHVFADPLELAPTDELFVECHFDNTAGNQRVVNGVPEEPRDLNWAEDEEMCVAYVTAAQ